MRRWALGLVTVGLVGVVVGVVLAATGGSDRDSDHPFGRQSVAGCATARATAGVVAPVFTAQGRGTIGAAEMAGPLLTAEQGFERAATEASGVRRVDFHDVASDYRKLRTDLASASSFSDPLIVGDFKSVNDDTVVLEADCT